MMFFRSRIASGRMRPFAFVVGLLFAAPVFASQSPEVMTVTETARLLRVTPATIMRMAQRNDLPARKMADGNWRFNRRALLVWLAGKDAAEVVSEVMGEPRKTMDPVPSRVAEDEQPAAPQTKTAATSHDSPPPARTIGARPEEAGSKEVALRETKLLLKRGQFLIEPGLSFERVERPTLAIVTPDGATAVATRRNQSTSQSVTVRVGGGENVEYSVGLAKLRNTTDVLFNDRIWSEQNNNPGVLSFGVRRDAWEETATTPGGILSLQGNLPTSHQARTLGLGMTLVKSLDPAVLSGSVHYWRSFVRDRDDLAQLTSRDSLALSLGYAYSLNDALTLQSSLTGTFSRRTRYASAVVPSGQNFRLNMGFSYALSKHWSVEPVLGFNLSGVGSETVLGIAFPYLMDAK